MNNDERALLTQFLDELASARAGTKDDEADAMIARTLSSNSDAAYLLVQHTIVADQSLHAAQQRIAELEQQRSAPAPTSASFLPQSNDGPWGSRQQDVYAPPPVEQRPGIFSSSGGLGSFLRNAGTTAAGVAGGEMLFSGLSGVFGHRGGGMFSGSQGFMDQPDNVTINNYGDDDGDSGNDDDDRSDDGS